MMNDSLKIDTYSWVFKCVISVCFFFLENITIETLTRGAPDLVLMMRSMVSLNTALETTTLKENIDEDKVKFFGE